ncbi:MAG: hypothetical protein O2798_06590 [Chloroflexi bacterium]|nr:hypothetical protein [Chloroflexota bacterium]MDA1240499.1 hypothetical protein [Chloroflexota bacterium]
MNVARLMLLTAVGGLALFLAACGGDDAAPSGGGTALRWDAQTIQQSTAATPFQPEVVTSGFGVGPNRLSLALFKPDQTLVGAGDVSLRVYRLAADPNTDPVTADLAAEVVLTARTLDLHDDHQTYFWPASAGDSRRAASVAPVAVAPAVAAHEDALTTVFAGNVELDTMGWWGLEITATVDGVTYERMQRRIFVQEHTPEPAIGDPVPPSRQATARDVSDLDEISSAIAPNAALLEMTVEEAVASGRPSVVAFVTPAFCQTRFCGPVLELVVTPAFERYGDRVNFLHIEPFNLERARNEGVLEPVPATLEWQLKVEPVIFVLDSAGLVSAKLEGITDVDELSAAIEAALQ